jgi:UDP-N-acetylmuramate dehydrogenase
VGGAARHWVEAHDGDEVVAALAWAEERRIAVEVLGGGSNVLVADRGLDALVLRVRAAGLDSEVEGDDMILDVGAGMAWDDLVAWAVERGLAGLECLSGIPGDVGAAPMQNVGAYGQEVAATIEQVAVIDRTSGARAVLRRQACDFGYRDSIFKRAADGRYVVMGVRFRLRRGGPPTVIYPELAQALGGGDVGLAEVRSTVIALRRKKSMVLDPDDENFRSAGSFFLNPTLAPDELSRVVARAKEHGCEAEPPRFPAPAGRVKLPAAWLIEHAGFVKGTRRGRVGISSRHSLAIVNCGGARASEVVAFASEVRARVRERFGVALAVEPRLLGFEPAEVAGLYD